MSRSVGVLVVQPFSKFYCGTKFPLEAIRNRWQVMPSSKFNCKVLMCRDLQGIAIEFATNAQQSPIRVRASERSESFCEFKTGLDRDGKTLQALRLQERARGQGSASRCGAIM